MPQVRASVDRPVLSAIDRQRPMLRARGGHGRRGSTSSQPGGDGHRLNRRVRPVQGHRLPRWQVAEGSAAGRVRSKHIACPRRRRPQAVPSMTNRNSNASQARGRTSCISEPGLDLATSSPADLAHPRKYFPMRSAVLSAHDARYASFTISPTSKFEAAGLFRRRSITASPPGTNRSILISAGWSNSPSFVRAVEAR